jgi:hypothetical protein
MVRLSEVTSASQNRCAKVKRCGGQSQHVSDHSFERRALNTSVRRSDSCKLEQVNEQTCNQNEQHMREQSDDRRSFSSKKLSHSSKFIYTPMHKI